MMRIVLSRSKKLHPYDLHEWSDLNVADIFISVVADTKTSHFISLSD